MRRSCAGLMARDPVCHLLSQAHCGFPTASSFLCTVPTPSPLAGSAGRAARSHACLPACFCSQVGLASPFHDGPSLFTGLHVSSLVPLCCALLHCAVLCCAPLVLCRRLCHSFIRVAPQKGSLTCSLTFGCALMFPRFCPAPAAGAWPFLRPLPGTLPAAPPLPRGFCPQWSFLSSHCGSASVFSSSWCNSYFFLGPLFFVSEAVHLLRPHCFCLPPCALHRLCQQPNNRQQPARAAGCDRLEHPPLASKLIFLESDTQTQIYSTPLPAPGQPNGGKPAWNPGVGSWNPAAPAGHCTSDQCRGRRSPCSVATKRTCAAHNME